MTVQSFPGATIESLDSKLSGYDIKWCETMVLHVDCNDADKDTDIETFAEQLVCFTSNLTYVK